MQVVRERTFFLKREDVFFMKKHIFGFFIALAIFASFAFIYSLFESNEHICILEKPVPKRVFESVETAGTRIVQAVAERQSGKLKLVYARDISDERQFAAIFAEEHGRMRHIDTVSSAGNGTRVISVEYTLPAGDSRYANLFVVPVRNGGAAVFDAENATPVLMEEDR